MKKFSLLIIAITFLYFTHSFSLSKNSQILKVYTFNRPPLYIVEKNSFSGILIEKTRKILKKADIKYKFFNMPPKRILESLKNEKNACSIGWFKTPEREKHYIYSKAFFTDGDSLIFVVRKEFKGNFRRIFNLSYYSITLVLGFDYGERINSMLKNSKIKKFRTNANAKNLLLLVKNKRVDCTIISEIEAHYWLEQPLFKDTLKIIPIKEQKPVKRYLIFSKSTDKTIIERVNKAIEELN